MSKELEFHEIANIFPLMNEIELESLCENIRTNGLLNPIILYDNKILDGRNRYLACKKANIIPIYHVYQGNMDLVDYVIAQNLERRHLTPAQKSESATLALEQKRTLREEQLKKIEGNEEELKRLKEAIEKKDKKIIADKYKTTIDTIEKAEIIKEEIKDGNEKIKKLWDKAKEDKVSVNKVFEKTKKGKKRPKRMSYKDQCQQLRKENAELKAELARIKERCVELNVWDKIRVEIKPEDKSNYPTMKELRDAELI